MANFKFDNANAASAMMKKGEYESALYYANLAYESSPDEKNELSVADAYEAMGLYDLALRIYMRQFAKDQQNYAALNGIIECLKATDPETAYYYMNYAPEDEIDEEEYFDDGAETVSVPGGDFQFAVHDKNDQSQQLAIAIELIEHDCFDDAMEILIKIGKDSPQYADALLSIATIYFKKRKLKQAENIVDEAIEEFPDRYGLYMLKIMINDALRRRDKIEQCAQKLVELDLKNEEDIEKAYMCLCAYGCYDKAITYIQRKLEFTPYDKQTLLCYQKAKLEVGENDQAVKIANRLNNVYHGDIEVEEMTKKIFEDPRVKMPKGLYDLKTDLLERMKLIVNERTLDNTEQTPVTKEDTTLIRWLFGCKEYAFWQSVMTFILPHTPEVNEMIDDLLLDPAISDIQKKQMLTRRVCDDGERHVKFVVSNVYRAFNVKFPRVEKTVQQAYRQAFVVFMVTEFAFQRALDRELKNFAASYEKCKSSEKSDIQEPTWGAVLFAMVKHPQDEEFLKFFGCNSKEYHKALRLLKITITPRKNDVRF